MDYKLPYISRCPHCEKDQVFDMTENMREGRCAACEKVYRFQGLVPVIELYRSRIGIRERRV